MCCVLKYVLSNIYISRNYFFRVHSDIQDVCRAMTCAESIRNLITEINAIVPSNSETCCAEYITPDLSAAISAVQTECATTCPILSPTDSNVYCVHNFDIPVHTLCEYLFRTDDTDVSSIATSCLWKTTFANTSNIPPRIDTLSPISTDEYYAIRAWCTMFTQYIQTAQSINRNDVSILQSAHTMLVDEESYLNDEMDTLHADQCNEDALQDAIDNPTEAWQCVQEQGHNDVRERMACNRAKRKRRSEMCGANKRQKRLFVPLGRRKMGCFEHRIVDTRFQQNVREVESNLSNVRERRVRLEEKRTLALTIQKTLRQLLQVFHNVDTLVLQFLKEWETSKIVCNTTSLPLPRRMTFQQQLKSSMFHAKALMRPQVFKHRWQLCEDVPNGHYDYCAYFNYSVQPCESVRSRPNIDVVLKASNSLLLYTQQQIVLQLLQTATFLHTGSVITKEHILCVVGQLKRAASVVDVVHV